MSDESDDGPRIVRWVGPIFLLGSAGLLPWAFYLFRSLPARQLTANYNLSWAGFDILLAIVLCATGYFAVRRSGYLVAAAASAATMLAVDAWFDITTSPSGGQMIEAVILAVFPEVPLALACVWLSYRAEHVIKRKISLFMAHTRHRR
jgi:hypothetical protein